MKLKKYVLTGTLTIAVISWILVCPLMLKWAYEPVKAIQVNASTVDSTVQCSGTVDAANKKDIALGYSVKISRALFKVGDKVKKGDTLLELDQNVTMQALSGLGTNTASSSQTVPQSANGDIEGAQSALSQALSSGLISQDTYSSLLNQIPSISSSAEKGPGGESDNDTASSGAVNQATILSELNECLKAPISGTILYINDGTDGITPAGTSIAQIADLHTLQIKAQVDESDLKNLKTGQAVEITGPGLQRQYRGSVDEIYPLVDKVSTNAGTKNMAEIVVGIKDTDDRLFCGLTADLTIRISEKSGIVKVPYDAVKQDEQGNEYVYLFKKGSAAKSYVRTGVEDDDGIEILGGVHRGDIVIEDANDQDLSGVKVRIA